MRYEVLVRPANSSDANHLLPLIDSEREALGHIPWPAFRDRIDAGHVLVADTTYGKVTAYLLMYLPKRSTAAPAQIHHVCVRKVARRAGIGRTLVEAAVARAALGSRQIVQAWCRSSLSATLFWRSMGFDPVGCRPGGAKRHDPLILWRIAADAAARQNGAYWQLPTRAGAASKNGTPMRLISTSEALHISWCTAPQLLALPALLTSNFPGKLLRSRS